MQDKSVTGTLCEFANAVRIEELPGAVVERAALLVTDSIGIAHPRKKRG